MKHHDALAPKLRAFVEGKVSSGEYASGDEVVAASLRLMAAREEKLARLRGLVAESDTDLKAGRFANYGSREEMLRDIRKRSRKLNDGLAFAERKPQPSSSSRKRGSPGRGASSRRGR
jgi:putative addiction module CopG family antidote